MPYVITKPCIGVKDKGCVTVCPCYCIEEGVPERDGATYDMLFIDPVHCIDRGLCESECPVGAIFAETDVPARWAHYAAHNAAFYGRI
ncbi:MAG TPA: ferredoxin [Chthonomonadaceae bacterium]|nr:ferredoxin [Chthonomonadaceae bacterium]